MVYHARVLCAMGVALAALGHAWAEDVKGGKDHPLISRYSGAEIDAYVQETYVELEIVRATAPAASSGRKYGDIVGGSLTSIGYLAPAKRTPLEVFRNYEKALSSGGFNLLHKCELAACVDGSRRLAGQGTYADQAIASRLSNSRVNRIGMSVEWTDGPSYFLSAQLKRASGDAYVMLWVTPGFGGGDKTGIFQYVLEAKLVETGLVTVNAAALGSGLAADGKIALYGIYFDTGKAELKPESKAQLDEMAKLLKESPTLRVYIVGHTDNQGALEANLALSQRRADAVIGALVGSHKIDAKRLAARGVASLSPVASNRAEPGRARNRRVELVEQ